MSASMQRGRPYVACLEILGRPYRDMTCRQVALWVWRQLGREVEIPDHEQGEPPKPDAWKRATSPLQLGDVILTRPTEGPHAGRNHLHTVVCVNPPQAVTSSAREGVHVVSVPYIGPVLGVFRPVPMAAGTAAEGSQC